MFSSPRGASIAARRGSLRNFESRTRNSPTTARATVPSEVGYCVATDRVHREDKALQQLDPDIRVYADTADACVRYKGKTRPRVIAGQFAVCGIYQRVCTRSASGIVKGSDELVPRLGRICSLLAGILLRLFLKGVYMV